MKQGFGRGPGSLDSTWRGDRRERRDDPYDICRHGSMNGMENFVLEMEKKTTQH